MLARLAPLTHKLYMSDLIDHLLEVHPHAVGWKGYSHFPITIREVVGIAFLCEWRAALALGSTLTDAAWKRGFFGPDCSAITDTLEMDPSRILLGEPRRGDVLSRDIRLLGTAAPITPEAEKIINFVLEVVDRGDYLDFIKIVAGTSIVYWSNYGDHLDLNIRAKEFLENRRLVFVTEEDEEEDVDEGCPSPNDPNP